ncbi:MAG TPA: GNAT family N-acetyltransferase [Thermoanaerobaculia bacterium]|nr:GNAT family N-acetyltransferase [Thermoanaerobaculia bacterium]
MAERAKEILTTAPPGLQLRWVEEGDLPFLAELYASTRREEVDRTPWTDEQKEAFLRWQFDNQHQHYQTYYPDCELLVIERDAVGRREPVGRLYVDRWKDQIRLVDIALLSEHRGSGLGTALLEQLLAEGRERALPVTIHVEYNNPALNLYRRLGFRHVDSNGIYYLMKWTPSP